jgi:hypothetical protein
MPGRFIASHLQINCRRNMDFAGAGYEVANISFSEV